MSASAEALAPVTALAAAWNRGDATAFGSSYWPDASFTNILGGVLRGRESITQQHARIFATFYKGSRFDFHVVGTVALGADHALVDTDAELTGFAQSPPGVMETAPGVMRTRLRHIVERRDAQWGILFSQNTAIAPDAPSSPGE